MNNFVASLKKMITNKNTVTILGTLVGIAILYFGYTWRINQQVEQVTVVVAKETIQPRTKITKDMVETIQIAKVMYDKMVDTNDTGISVIRSINELSTAFPNGSYSNVNALIPKGSILIRDASGVNGNVIDKNSLPNNKITQIIENGKIPYAFSVSSSDTYGNAIMDGMYVNIYMKATSDDGKPMIGKLLQNVKVEQVQDSSGRDVFENTSENRTPATLIFGVDEEYHLLLRKANYLSSNNVSLIAVPTSSSLIDEDSEDTIEITSSYLKQYIEDRTVNVPEDQLPENEVKNNDDNTTTTNKDE